MCMCVRIFISCTFAECLLYVRHLYMPSTCYMPGTPLKEQRDRVLPNHYNFSSETPGWSQWERGGLLNNICVNCQEIFLHRQQERGLRPLHWDTGRSLENFPEEAAFQLTLDEWAKKGQRGSEGIQTEEESEQRPGRRTPSATTGDKVKLKFSQRATLRQIVVRDQMRGKQWG